MIKYDVVITEVLRRTVTVDDADTLEEAIDLVHKKYDKEELILDSSDFTDVYFSTETKEDGKK